MAHPCGASASITVGPEPASRLARLRGMITIAPCSIATLPSDYWGEIIVAAAEGTGGTLDWRRTADERLAVIAKHKRPRAYIALDELPRNAQGKISRLAIREAILARYTLEDGPYPKLTDKPAT